MGNVYHANYRSADVRRSGFADVCTFGAADDTAGEAIAALLDAACSAQRVSLTTRVQTGVIGADHPAGSRFSARVVCQDAAEAVQTYHVRNINNLLVAKEEAVAALFLGEAWVDALYGVTALSEAPKLVNTGSNITVANVMIVNKT